MEEKTIEDILGCVRIFSRNQRPSSRFNRLDDESEYCVLVAAAFLDRFAKINGPEKQRFFFRLPSGGLRTESDLRSWIGDSFARVNTNRWDSSRRRAQELLASGIKVFVPAAPFPGPPECPGILFGKDCPPEPPPLLAVFNSRKPRQVSPDSSWLDAMRRFLRGLDQREIGLAGSTGTLTHDLASVLAGRRGLFQLIVAPFPLLAAQRRLSKLFGEGASGIPTLSCMHDGAGCPAKLPMRCRDRILASLADFHLVLEIRSRGNLLAVLEQIQSKSPRPQFVLKPETHSSSNTGNFTLLNEFPDHAVEFKWSRPLEPVLTGPVATVDSMRFSNTPSRGFCLTFGANVPWRDYLFHYTRACSGPWPGETYLQYLLELLDAGPLSMGRSALDSIVRIAREGLLRASCQMVRGTTPVVCWSSLPPQKLSLMRKWHGPLARWNVEPYGVAVRRDVLRSLGAKPAIYGGEEVYAKLPDSEKYRFQLSRPGQSAAWRHEREWRIANDLALGGLKPEQGFFFVQTAEEVERPYGCSVRDLPVVAIKESDCC